MTDNNERHQCGADDCDRMIPTHFAHCLDHKTIGQRSWAEHRSAVLDRDGNACHRCGRYAASAIRTGAHGKRGLVPLHHLAACCERCWPKRAA